MKKHWSEIYTCSCGAKFRTYAAEAFHRHNFPTLCRKRKSRAKLKAEATTAQTKP